MRCQRRSDAVLAMARLLDFGDGGIEFDFRRYRESQHVVQLHGQVRELQLCSEKVLLSFESLRLALDELFVERAAILYLLTALILKVVGSADFRFRGALVELRDQNLVVNLMDP